MIKLNLNENFICRIWEDSSFYSNLETSCGKSVVIEDKGRRNSDAGPDYYDAKIRIDGILYSGCVEIHRSENDWHEHKHNKDNKYNEVILQIVFYRDVNSNFSSNPVVKKSRKVHTVFLSEFLSKSVHEIWKDIINNPSERFRIPCFPANKDILPFAKKEWLEYTAAERLKYKSQKIEERICNISEKHSKKIIWEQALFEFICEALGFSKNKMQFLRLAGNIDIAELHKLNPERIQIEALLFGLSGFLKDLRFRDDYIDELKFHWSSLKDIVRKENMDKSEWNFFRLRPANFPTIRIAYASALLYEIIYNDFFKKIIRIFDNGENILENLINLFKEAEVSYYWKHHYNFGKKSSSETKTAGKDRIRDIISNVLLPLVYHYSVSFLKPDLQKRTMNFYFNEKQKSGGNEITRVMEKQLGVTVRTLADEQALIQLHNYYCIKDKCSNCGIGKLVFSNEKVNEPLKIILY
jgi:hypothetical protein